MLAALLAIGLALGPVSGGTASASPHGPRNLHTTSRQAQHRSARATGVPQAPTVLYQEDFEHSPAAGAVRLSAYTGAAPLSETYTADPAWLANCNGWVVNDADSAGYAPGIKDCANNSGWWNNSRSLAKLLGEFHGSADPAQNHAVTAYTTTNTGANKVEFETAKPVSIPSGKRFISFGVDSVAQNCGVSGPQLKFYLVDGAKEIAATSKAINPCTDKSAETVGNAKAVSADSDAPVLFSGTELGIRMVNANGSGTGNDAAFDNIKVLDVSPHLSKAFGPEVAPAGGTSTLTFTVTNTTDLAAKKGWSFTDDLPKGLTVADPAGTSTTCANGAVTTEPGGTAVKLAGDLTEGQSSCTLSVRVTAAAGMYSNCAANISALVGLHAPDCAEVEFQTPHYTIAKTSTPASGEPVVPGSKVEYTLRVANPGKVPVDATVRDDLAKVEDDADYNDDAKASLGDAPAYADGKVTWSHTLVPGETATLTYSVTVKDPAAGDGVLTNRVTGSDQSNCPTGDEDGCTSTLRTAVLKVVKKASAAHATAGEQVTYTVTATNSGKGDYRGAVIADDLAGTLDDAAYNADAKATAGTVAYTKPKLTWTGDVPAGKTVTLTYSVTVDNPLRGDGTLKNTVTGPPGSNCAAGSTDPECTTGTPLAALEITKSASASEAKPSDRIDYTLTVANTGTAAYPNATVTDDLAKVLDDAKYNDDAAATAGAVAVAGHALTWTGDVPAGETVTITYSVTVTGAAEGDSALVNAVVGPPGSNCAAGSTDAACTSTVDLAALRIVKKAHASGLGKVGTDVEYTLTVTNTGKAAYPNATVTDNLAGVLDDAAYNGDAKADAGAVSYSAPTLTWTGDLAAGQTATLTYSVGINAPGSGDLHLKNRATGPIGSNCEPGSADTACATDTGVALLEIAKTSSAVGEPVVPGQKVTYTVTLHNAGTAAYTDAALSDDLAGVLDDAVYNKDAKASAGTVGYTRPKLTWTGTLKPGATATVRYSVTVHGDPAALGDRTLKNALVGPPDSNCPAGSTDPKCTTENPIASLTVSKTADTSDPKPGDTVHYTVTVSNDSTEAAYPGAAFTDDLTGVLDDARYNDDAAATAGSVTYTKPHLHWKGDLPAGGTVAVTYSVTVQDPPGGDKKLTNAVTAPGSNCPKGGKDPACRTTTGIPTLVIEKTADINNPKVGDRIGYTLTVHNDGQAAYPGAVVTDDLAKVLDDADYNDDAKADHGTVAYTEPTVTWSGDLAQGATATITYSVTVTAKPSGNGRYINRVTGPPGSNCRPETSDPRCQVVLPTPGFDFGDAPDSYGTLLKHNAAYAEITPGLHLGHGIGAEQNGQPNAQADLDKHDDAVTGPVILHQHQPTYSLTLRVTDTTGKPAMVAGWIDTNRDGRFETTERAEAPVAPGATRVTLHWTGLTPMKPGRTYLRLRLFGDTALERNRALMPIRPAGFGGPGEVEDYTATIAADHLVIAKTAAPTSPRPGQKVSYTVTVANSSAAEYDGATFTDDLTKVLDDAHYNADATATAGATSYTAPKLSWHGTVPARQRVTVHYSVTVDDPDRGDRVLANAVTGPSGSTCDPCTTTTKVPGPPNAPSHQGHPGNDQAAPVRPLPDTGAPNSTIYLAVAAALLLASGAVVTTVVRRRGSR
ncbi:hypothetical protein BIV57_01190 [Mangrovactinospora gilvigrisea]|uniref:Gram-positive cocci surface proteins LPxTG domain-containing protein n=1 Tax=Mangrovactinospora gilvigrisea TaxID=1428644 RepID=A0A1J7BLJ8_9ACTN|nr:GEVED domain-containing protein [Mangrovactinospora gilvigrisea]OIV39477.1 hypothetical protein BIV57_01190 [Mangrovactinospora gilvigrisea]